jgi:hypothetical protein
MADKKISDLTQNPTITGEEEMALEKSGANFKSTFEEFKTWLGVGDSNIEGGNSQSIYLQSQIIDGGDSN